MRNVTFKKVSSLLRTTLYSITCTVTVRVKLNFPKIFIVMKNEGEKSHNKKQQILWHSYMDYTFMHGDQTAIVSIWGCTNIQYVTQHIERYQLSVPTNFSF